MMKLQRNSWKISITKKGGAICAHIMTKNTLNVTYQVYFIKKKSVRVVATIGNGVQTTLEVMKSIGEPKGYANVLIVRRLVIIKK